MANQKKIKIMVGSTVYGFEDQLIQISAILTTLGYDVINSHIGTVSVDSKKSNLKNCLEAVKECDIFLGIIRPYYGTGNIGEKNITFEEMKLAIKLKKPYWFLAHRDVTFARNLFRHVKTNCKHSRVDPNYECDCEPQWILEKNSVFDYRCLEIYDHVVKSSQKDFALRKGNWVQEFNRIDEALVYITAQFSDVEKLRNMLNAKDN